MRYLILSFVLVFVLAIAGAEGGVTFREAGDSLEVFINGHPFTTYRHGPGVTKPYFWPIAGPFGLPVTRAFPNVLDAPGETRDHAWHRGLSFTHGDVGFLDRPPVDFWREGALRQGRVIHRAFDPGAAVKDGALTFGTVDDWVGPEGTKLISDRVSWRIEELGEGSILISSTIRLSPVDSPIRFGDSEEGSFAVRIATSMDEKSEQTGPRSEGPRGRITNSRGEVGASKCWGRESGWVDYSGQVGGQNVGIAIFDHADNLPRARWHVRDYGLFSANPFGHKVFKTSETPVPLTLELGQTLVLRYAILIHPGDVGVGQVARRYENYLRETP